MRFASGVAAVAVAASLVAASPTPQEIPTYPSTPVGKKIDVSNDLTGEVLVAGEIGADPTTGEIGKVLIACRDCKVSGNIDATVRLVDEVPLYTITLSGMEAKLDLDIDISKRANITVGLFEYSETVDLPLLGLTFHPKTYIDLVFTTDVKIDLSAGIYFKLVDNATISSNILNGDLIENNL